MRFYIVPNLTKENPSTDAEYRKFFYRAFAGHKDGSRLSFQGYFRAIIVYGGEAHLKTSLRAGSRDKFLALCKKQPDLLKQYRAEAQEAGILSPQENFFDRVIFANHPEFFWTVPITSVTYTKHNTTAQKKSKNKRNPEQEEEDRKKSSSSPPLR
ncbi:hypothetical protein LY78DRAFT_686193 [Colletotrichum sublineola]|uniref:Uncharacterized protein n=1 Tax=Colletotrichum sublineola TaxID=1173701 RepID=A0A066WUX9_COLSU|nr:hypothetical protein LY78DRAFT_686193 [Colletotrichum sublineola]KDN60497.1 hypothetical protein CSUB01_10763 [Colletotrichum sublineola]